LEVDDREVSHHDVFCEDALNAAVGTLGTKLSRQLVEVSGFEVEEEENIVGDFGLYQLSAL
jgi:hypothetical protein